MKVKKQISLLLAAALLCTSVGCGRTKTSVVVEDNPVTLRVMTMFGGTDKSAETYGEIKQEYQKAHKNVILEAYTRQRKYKKAPGLCKRYEKLSLKSGGKQ